MSYLVLARKYRPSAFSAVAGQDHVTRTLGNAIRRSTVAHAYLFSGPRGVGKTSVARIFSKALNCVEGPTSEPCLECTNCKEIAEGRSLAVREIDGASHNSVDNVRELIESFRSLPAPGSRYKIYIIDEVHMLSTSAFNALLKSLEEPPPNTLFVLATTEPHKIPDTVISRCQRYDFRAIGVDVIAQRLQSIAAEEGIDVETPVFRMIARLSEGSMRDAQSLLDRVQSFCDGKLTAVEAGQVLGVVDRRTLFQISSAIFARDVGAVLEVLDEAFAAGLDPALFLRDFVSHWRELLLAKFGGGAALKKIGLGNEDLSELVEQVQEVSGRDVQDLVQVAREGADAALRSAYPKYAFEALAVRMAARESVRDVADVIGALRRVLSGSRSAAVQTSRPSSAPKRVKPQRSPRQSAVRAPEAPAQPVKKAEPQEVLEGSAAVKDELNWAEFVEYTAENGALIVAEHLRRLSIQSFAAGRLEAKGPEFSIRSLEQQETRQKLDSLLESYSGTKRWRVTFTNGVSGNPEPESLLHQERVQSHKRKAEKVNTLKQHPSVKSIKKAFPGTVIESIKVKES